MQILGTDVLEGRRGGPCLLIGFDFEGDSPTLDDVVHWLRRAGAIGPLEIDEGGEVVTGGASRMYGLWAGNETFVVARISLKERGYSGALCLFPAARHELGVRQISFPSESRRTSPGGNADTFSKLRVMLARLFDAAPPNSRLILADEGWGIPRTEQGRVLVPPTVVPLETRASYPTVTHGELVMLDVY